MTILQEKPLPRVPVHAWLSVLLGVLTVVAFWEIQDHEFINYDDNVYIVENPAVVSGFTVEGVRRAFGSGKHPLTWLSHMLDVELYQMWAGGHHRSSLLFHLANVLLLYQVLRRATGASWQSAAVAALFAIHPLHVESVAWASERKDVLSTFFWLLCTWAYLRFVETPGVGRYLLILLLLSLGLMSKAMLVTLPFTLLLLDYWPLARLARDDWKVPSGRARIARVVVEKVPLLGLALIASAIAYWFQTSGGGTQMLRPLSVAERMTNALVAYAKYIEKTFWPRDLIFFYPHPVDSLGVGEVAGAALLLAAITVGVWIAREHRYLSVGWLWYLGTLVPVIGFVQIGRQAMADRYTYVPLIGVFVAIVWGIAEATTTWRYRKPLLGVTALLLALVLTHATRLQVAHWHDNFSLYEHALRVMPDNAVAHHNIGLALSDIGKREQAIEHYERAIEIEPDFVNARVDLGIDLGGLGRSGDAVRELSHVLAIQPEHALANFNLGLIHRQRGELDAAIANLRRAVDANPHHASAHLGLGSLLASQGEFEEAVRHFREALRIDPRNPSTHVQLGAVHAISGRLGDAIHEFETALQIDPQLEQARELLNLARQKQAEKQSD